MIRNLDKMVENSEYKETLKYLEPLKFVTISWLRKKSRKKIKHPKIEILLIQSRKWWKWSPNWAKISKLTKYKTCLLVDSEMEGQDSGVVSVLHLKLLKEDITRGPSKKCSMSPLSPWSASGKNQSHGNSHAILSETGLTSGEKSSLGKTCPLLLFTMWSTTTLKVLFRSSWNISSHVHF